MVKQEDFDKLKESVDALKADLCAKSLAASIEAPLRASIASLDDKIGLTNRLLEVEKDVKFWKILFTCILILLPIVGVLAGFLGVRSYEDFGKYVHKLVEDQASSVRELGYGLALADKQPQFAIPYLLSSFKKDPHNEPLVASLLIATDGADDWSTGHDVLKTLANQPISFTSPWTYNAMGLAAINTGLSDAGDLSLAKQYFDAGLRHVGKDFEAAWYLHTNMWRYYLAKHDIQKAECEAALAATVETPVDAPSWAKASKWTWFDEYFKSKDPISKIQVTNMYKQFTEVSEFPATAQTKAATLAAAQTTCEK